MRPAQPAASGRRQRLPRAQVGWLAGVARPWLAGAIVVGVGQSVLVLAQAVVLARLLSAALTGGAGRRRALARGIGFAASGGIAGPGRDDPGPGGLAALIGPGIDDLDPFVGRVLPRTVLALAVPALLLAWIAHLDLLSAALAGIPLALGPLLAVLIGMDTAAAVRRRLAGLERLADRFAGLVGGLAVLRAFGRAGDHEHSVAAS